MTLNDPKYLIISSKDNGLRKLSPFIIHRGLNAISTLIDSISQLRDGNLLILVRNQVIADKFLKAKTLLNICEINVQLHETLNYVKGVVYAPCLKDVPEEETVNELRTQGVVSVYKFTTKIDDGTIQCNGNMVLTFNLYNLPNVIDVAWYKVKVKTYFPNPMRCRNCQLLGHTKNKCSNQASCDICNLPPHDSTKCTRVQCANCRDEHPSSDKNCPRYIQQKEIIKTLDKCSFGAAKRKYEINIKSNTIPDNLQTFSEIIKETDNLNNQTTKIQQKRNATSPKPKKIVKKLSRRNSLSSSSNENENIPSTSNTVKKSKTINSTSNSTTTNISSSQPKIISTTTVQKEPTKQNTESLTIDTDSDIINEVSSPLGKITQTLIDKEQYFIPTSERMDSDG